MKVFEVLQPDKDKLYNKQHAAAYAFVIFSEKMMWKYNPVRVHSFEVSSSACFQIPTKHITVYANVPRSWSLTDKERATWARLYDNMVDAKKKYEAAGGNYKK